MSYAVPHRPHRQFRLGRQRRRPISHIPHLSAMRVTMKTQPAVTEVDYHKALRQPLGAMLNDQLGDCTCAGIYHGMQTWTANAGPRQLTEPDSCVQQLYETCGYVPGNPATDQGANEADLLGRLLKTGIPMADGTHDPLLGVFEVDLHNANDMLWAMAECGFVYLGIDFLASYTETPGATWGVTTSPDVEGGHCTISGKGSLDTGIEAQSWGEFYEYPWGAVRQTCEEAYALISKRWVEATGKTPFGMSLDQLQASAEATLRALA